MVVFGVIKFQFPSSGKAQSDKLSCHVWMRETMSFHSLQTGRHSQPKRLFRLWKTCLELFQFPSNGKAQSDKTIQSRVYSRIYVSIPFKREGTFRHNKSTPPRIRPANVSIPFKREGTVRQTYKSESSPKLQNSFNSLQTGRHIQTRYGEHYAQMG